MAVALYRREWLDIDVDGDISAPDRDTTVDADDVIAVAEELLTLVG